MQKIIKEMYENVFPLCSSYGKWENVIQIGIVLNDKSSSGIYNKK